MDASSFHPLARVLNVLHKDISNLCIAIIRTKLLESHKIWCSRNVCIDFFGFFLSYSSPFFPLYLSVVIPGVYGTTQ